MQSRFRAQVETEFLLARQVEPFGHFLPRERAHFLVAVAYDGIELIEALFKVVFHPVGGIIPQMADAGRKSDLLVVGQQAENHLVVAMLSDGLQKDLEKLVDGPGLVAFSTYSSNRIAMSSLALAILIDNNLTAQVVSR